MNFFESLVSVFAPHVCLGCGLEGVLACADCLGGLRLPSPACYRCGTANPTGRTCDGCRRNSRLVSVNAAAVYDGLAKDLVWRLKFDRAKAAADSMASCLSEAYAQRLSPDMLLIPVPTAAKRVRRRGYDQAELIARCLARQTGLTYAPLLGRLGSQEQKTADRQRRQRQLKGAFYIKKPPVVNGARILLIDDVLTTGATMEEAARILSSGGAKAVGALVFVRA